MSTAKDIKRSAPDLADEVVGRLAQLIEERFETFATQFHAQSFTISQFRARHGLSKSQYFKLQRDGRAPATMSIGSYGLRISRAAEAAWIADREREAAEGRQAAE